MLFWVSASGFSLGRPKCPGQTTTSLQCDRNMVRLAPGGRLRCHRQHRIRYRCTRAPTESLNVVDCETAKICGLGFVAHACREIGCTSIISSRCCRRGLLSNERRLSRELPYGIRRRVDTVTSSIAGLLHSQHQCTRYTSSELPNSLPIPSTHSFQLQCASSSCPSLRNEHSYIVSDSLSNFPANRLMWTRSLPGRLRHGSNGKATKRVGRRRSHSTATSCSRAYPSRNGV